MVWCFSLMWLSGQNHQELYTNTYVVPPGFLNGPPQQGWQPRDPFAEFQPEVPRKTAKQILEEAGITFGEGASAIYNPATSQLIVRNSQDQMQLVESYIESIRRGGEKQIYLTFREIFIDEKGTESVENSGFDWLLISSGASDVSTQGGRRSLDSYQSFLEELSRPPTIPKETPPIFRKVAGVFTGPQFQVMIRALKKKFPSIIESLPSVMVRSGQPGLIQVGRQRYGVIAHLGADEFTIDLSVFLPEHGKALFQPGDALTTPYKVSIWDGQTVALSAAVKGKGTRTVFLTARLMDPAGMPINPEGGQRESEKAKTEKITPEEMPKSIEELTEGLQENGTDSLPQGMSYLVTKDDTLYSIATDTNTPVAKLKALNRLDTDDVEDGQIILVPDRDDDGAPELESVLASTIIPLIAFEDTPLIDGLGFIHRALLEEMDAGLFPKPVPKIILEGTESLATTPITLRLSNVPVTEALRYITSLAQCRYKVEGTRIIILPLE